MLAAAAGAARAGRLRDGCDRAAARDWYVTPLKKFLLN
jgi:hypothetical protein